MFWVTCKDWVLFDAQITWPFSSVSGLADISNELDPTGDALDHVGESYMLGYDVYFMLSMPGTLIFCQSGLVGGMSCSNWILTGEIRSAGCS